MLAEYVLDDPLTVTVPVQKVSKMTQKESKRVKNDPKRVKKVSFLVVQKVTHFWVIYFIYTYALFPIIFSSFLVTFWTKNRPKMVQKVLKSAVFSSFLVYFEHPPSGGVLAGYALDDPLTCSGTTQKGVKKGSKSGILGAKNDQKRCPKSDLIFGQLFHIHLSTFTVHNEALFGPKIDQKWVIFDVIFDQKSVFFNIILEAKSSTFRQRFVSKRVSKKWPKKVTFWHFWDPKNDPLFGGVFPLWPLSYP